MDLLIDVLSCTNMFHQYLHVAMCCLGAMQQDDVQMMMLFRFGLVLIIKNPLNISHIVLSCLEFLVMFLKAFLHSIERLDGCIL